jgi:hypothetical protein
LQGCTGCTSFLASDGACVGDKVQKVFKIHSNNGGRDRWSSKKNSRRFFEPQHSALQSHPKL